MTFDAFIAKNKNYGLDFDGSYGFQCVDLARYYWRDVLEISQPRGVSGAKNFWTNYDSDPNLKNNFTKIADSKELIPLKGDVMIWGANHGVWGHIAIVIEGTANDFTCFSQNDPTGAKSIIKYYKNFNGTLGVLRPKRPNNGSSEPGSDNMSDLQACLKLHGGLMEEIKEKDKIISELTADKDRYQAERDQARDDYAEKIGDQATDIKALKESLERTEVKLATCEAQSDNAPIVDEELELNGRTVTEISYDSEGKKIREDSRNYRVIER